MFPPPISFSLNPPTNILQNDKYHHKCFGCGTTVEPLWEASGEEEGDEEVEPNKITVDCPGCTALVSETITEKWKDSTDEEIVEDVWQRLWTTLQTICTNQKKAPKWLQEEYETAGSF